jgi:hypothetical protein
MGRIAAFKGLAESARRRRNPKRSHRESAAYLSPNDHECHEANPNAHQHAAVLAGPLAGPQVGPSLTAAARDGRTFARARMEEWLRRRPNQRIAPNRSALRTDTLIPSPQSSTKPGQAQHSFFGRSSKLSSAIGPSSLPRRSKLSLVVESYRYNLRWLALASIEYATTPSDNDQPLMLA